MTWTSRGQIVVAGSNKTTGTTITSGAQQTYLPVVGDVIIVTVAIDNSATATGNAVDTSEVTNVTDTKGNTYTKLREFTRGSGAAAAGTSDAVWACLKVTAAWASTDTISATHANVAAKVIAAAAFTPSNANGGTVDATSAATATAVADPPSFTLTPAGGSKAYLWLYALSVEGASTDTDAADTTNGWTRLYVVGTSAGAAATNQTSVLGYQLTTAASRTADWTHSATITADNAQIMLAITENGALFTKTFSGSMTPGGTITKQTRKTQVGAMTPTGLLGPDTTAKVFVGALTPAGTYAASPAGGIIPVTVLSGADDNTSGVATVFTTASYAFQNNKLYLISVGCRSTTAVTAFAISGGGLTWVQAREAPVGGGTQYVAMFRAMVPSGASTGALTITVTGGPATSIKWVVTEITGVKTTGSNGNDAIVQGATNQAASGTGSVSLAAFADPVKNAVFAYFQHGTAEAFTVDASGGYTLLMQDNSTVAPVLGVATEFAIGQDTTVTMTWATTSTTWRAIAVELAAIPVGGPTTYFQTLTGGMTPAGVLGPDTTSKVLVGAMTPAGLLGPDTTAKTLVGAMTPAGALTRLKMSLKTLAGGMTPTAALQKQTAKTFGGSTSPVTALIKQAGKLLTGALTPAGTLQKALPRTLPGSVTPAGALVKQSFKTVAGTMTPSGLLTRLLPKTFVGGITPTATFAQLKVVLKTLSGTVTPSGVKVLLVQKTVTGSITPAGAFTKRLSAFRTFAGSITPTATFVQLKAIFKTLSGNITPTGTVTKVLSSFRAFTGSMTPAGTLQKRDSKTFAGSITPAATFAQLKVILRSFSGALTPTATLAKSTLKSVSGTIGPVGSFAKSTAKTLVGAITPTGVLVRLKATLKTFAGNVTPAGLMSKTSGKTLAGTVTPTTSLKRGINKTYVGSITPAGTLTKGKALLRTFNGGVTPTGQWTKKGNKVFVGVITPTGQFTKTATHVVGEITGDAYDIVVEMNAYSFVVDEPYIESTDAAFTFVAETAEEVTVSDDTYTS